MPEAKKNQGLEKNQDDLGQFMVTQGSFLSQRQVTLLLLDTHFRIIKKYKKKLTIKYLYKLNLLYAFHY